MPTHRRHQLGTHRLACALAVTTAVGLVMSGSAQAAPAVHADPPTVQDVKAQVDQLYSQAEQASEKYNAALEYQKRLQKEADDLEDQVAAGQGELNKLRGDLAYVAAAQYRAGGMSPNLELMLASDPAAYLARMRSLGQAAERQRDTLHQLLDRQRLMSQRRAEAGEKLAELEQARQTLSDAKDQIQQRLGTAQRLLNSLGAAERARLTADDAREAEQRATRGTDRLDLGSQPPSSERAAIALAAAISKIGSPYVYGATGPGSFDCSGLMYWAWRQAGVSLPRTSQEQANAGQRVSLAEARPGDLVIFYKDMHHVGMYAGGGVVVHAPYPGARVRYESVNAMPVAGVVRV